MTPSEIMVRGFATSAVVMMNEAHSGMSRCVRTRRIGREILPAAHDAGCRHLAMEALPNLDHGPTFGITALPARGYLGQPEMRELAEAALELEWTLVAYEIGRNAMPIEHRDNLPTWESTNYRERVQAENLVAAWQQIRPAPMMVWCGNAHHAKLPAQEWTPMGVHFKNLAGFEPFSIDQTATIAFAPGHKANIELTDDLRATVEARGGTAGFIAGDAPPGLEVPDYFDAMILSTDNEMVGSV
jgi:hypothetical protein